jgi:hypothetical protein
MSSADNTHFMLNELSDQIIATVVRDRRGLQQYVLVDDETRTGIKGVSGIVLETESWLIAIRVAVLEKFVRGRLSAKELVEKNDLPIEDVVPF